MNKELLLKAADKLDALKLKPGDRFDMGKWGRITGCGTVACAWGHLTFDQEMRAAGLKGVWFISQLYNEVDSYDGNVIGDHYDGPLLQAMAVFDIPRSTAEAIFTADGYVNKLCREITPQDVAAQIRRIVNEQAG